MNPGKLKKKLPEDYIMLYHVPINFFQEKTLKCIFLYTFEKGRSSFQIMTPTVCHTNQVISPLDKPSDDLLTLQKVQLNLSLYPSINSHKKIKLSMFCKITNYLLKVNKLTTFTCNILANKTDIQNVYAFSLIIVFHDEILIKRD